LISVEHSKSFIINQPVDILFPLFSAEGEKLWVPGWDYHNVMGSTDLHEDYVFITQNHDHASSKAVWIVKRYEPQNYLIQFYKVESEDKVGVITVQCSPLEESKTEVIVSYKYTGLTEKGNAFVREFTPQKYEEFIDEWQKLLRLHFEQNIHE